MTDSDPEFDLLLHGDAWDAEHGRRTDRWLAVTDGTIETVAEEPPGTAAQTIETEVFIPGLVDMHVHLVWDGSSDPVATLREESEQELIIRAIANARAQLNGGVTTVRDLGSVNDVAITVGQAIDKDRIPGPTVVASGRTIVITGGHDPFWAIESDGIAACRRAVRELRSRGAALVKVSATGGVYGQAVGEDPGAAELSPAELEAIVDEADRFGLPVAAHAVGADGIMNAIEAGVTTLEHGNLMREDALSRLVECDIAYDPTLYVYQEIACDETVPEYARANAQRVYRRHQEVFAAACETEARILAGSDAGSPGTPHPSLHRELTCLVEACVCPEEALTAATRTAADEIGRKELGTLTPGTPADIVGFGDDPLTDIEATASPAVVIKAGQVIRSENP